MDNLNKVQNAALDLISGDARFLITLVDMFENSKNINSNYIIMAMPYIGVFAHGAELWARKVGLSADVFSSEEYEYYTYIRGGCKLFENSYYDLQAILKSEFEKSDKYFYKKRTFLEKIIGYYNFGADKLAEKYCGNTIVCSAYIPFSPFDKNSGPKLKELSKVAGKLAFFYCGHDKTPYKYSHNLIVTSVDFNFNKNSPITVNTFDGLMLFSILCNINYVIIFLENIIIEEVAQKFKFAYLQYYYLCGFIKDLNKCANYHLHLNDSLFNREFRNCLSHYGLGQYIDCCDLFVNDPLKGLTQKAFDMDYFKAKEILFDYLSSLADQIEKIIF